MGEGEVRRNEVSGAGGRVGLTTQGQRLCSVPPDPEIRARPQAHTLSEGNGNHPKSKKN